MAEKDIKRYVKAKVLLKGKRILLKDLTEKDIPRLIEICNDKSIFQFTHVPYPYKKKDAADFIRILRKSKKDASGLFLGIYLKKDKDEGQKQDLLIGNICLSGIIKADNLAQIGYLLDKKHRNKGYVSEALKLLLDYSFNKIKFNRIEISCSTENKISRRVIEKTGAIFEGISRKKCHGGGIYHDLRQYAILREEYKNK